MKRSVVIPLTAAIAACGVSWVALAAPADPPPPPSPMERMQRWTQNHEALLTAKLAGLKAGLKLTADQDKLWAPFETSVRDAAQARAERMKARMEARAKANDDDGPDAQRMNPVERLDKMAERMTQGGASLKKIADAAKPLYASLDDGQKRLFGYLSRELMMMGHPRMGAGMGPGPREAWMGPHGGHWGPRGPEGFGIMMRGGPDGPGPHGPRDNGPPPPPPVDGPDGPDDE